MKIETEIEIENEMCVNSNQVFVYFFIHFYRAHFIAHPNLFNVRKKRGDLLLRDKSRIVFLVSLFSALVRLLNKLSFTHF